MTDEDDRVSGAISRANAADITTPEATIAGMQVDQVVGVAWKVGSRCS